MDGGREGYVRTGVLSRAGGYKLWVRTKKLRALDDLGYLLAFLRVLIRSCFAESALTLVSL